MGVGVYLLHHPLHSFSPEVGVGAYMVMGAYKVLYSSKFQSAVLHINVVVYFPLDCDYCFMLYALH